MITIAQCLAQLSREFPTAWRECDKLRASRGQNGVPDWIKEILMPFSGWERIVKARYQLPVLTWESWTKTVLLGTLGAWRPTQGIYQFSPALYDAIIDTPIGDDIPAEVLLRLPEWCMYIETPGLTYLGKAFDGFFVLLDHDTGRNEIDLCFLLWINTGETRAFSLSLTDGSQPAERVSLRRALERSLERAKNRATDADVSPEIQKILAQVNYDEATILKLLNLVLYLCSNNLEVANSSGETSPRPLPTPQRNKTGFRLYPPDSPTIWRVGENLSRQISDAQKQPRNERTEHKSHTAPRPHIRRGHWHGFWSGPRKPSESTSENARKFAVKWLPPIPVALGNESKESTDSLVGGLTL